MDKAINLFILLLLFISIESNSLESLYTPINSTHMKNIISNMTSIIEGYAYLDISKNPPNSLHEAIDLIKELNAINTATERPFYEFYRDIRRVIGKLKDVHLMPIPSFNSFDQYMACIPVSFYIDIDDKKEYQLYMKDNSFCSFIYPYTQDIERFINNAINDKIEISSINGEDPFNYIQNFGKEFLSLKNDHSHFTTSMQIISIFNLHLFPFNESELSLNIELSDGQKQNISYHIFQMPQTNLNAVKQTNLNWNYGTEEFKCRVDEVNKFNVFYQNSFSFENVSEIKEIIYNCSKLFHENDYKIIGIESRNMGGTGKIGIYLEQLLQPKICTNRMLFSIRKNDFLEDNFEQLKKQYLDFSTCKAPESFEKFFLDEPDNYGNNITHYRTIILDEITLDMKKDLHSKREELINTNKTKKPTEIIIFTDYESISATSIFLKTFQQSGGAIIVGYYGNPKNNLTTRDSGVSSSGIINYEWTTYYKNLKDLGFVLGITGQEFYDFDYQKENPIPQEYTVIPVDEHVNIYEDYSDDNYDKFISEARNIFDKYNNFCNINNTKLFLEDDNCYNIDGDSHAHGGYPCGDDGHWDKTKCQTFYCDLGYYYDTYQMKCIEDICTKTEDDKEEEYNEEEEENDEEEYNEEEENNNEEKDNKDSDELIPLWAIFVIVVGGVLVLIISLILIRRTVNSKRAKESIEITGEARLME